MSARNPKARRRRKKEIYLLLLRLAKKGYTFQEVRDE